MFYIRHPKQVGDQRAVAMQVVNQEQSGAVNRYVLIVDPADAAKRRAALDRMLKPIKA
ncbi:hypothetical protein [Janthinobacterium sp.]|uniref:hypothetical protein n=1 Tax=Janthinobacterium sp. TaxID=1871054 RepID=UPI00293D3143|nr:hypothetical protein [Janthinobacterium sp.]